MRHETQHRDEDREDREDRDERDPTGDRRATGTDDPERNDEEDSARDPNVPFEPHEDDDSPFGDTDQHSSA